jgi:hypothetical protein
MKRPVYIYITLHIQSRSNEAILNVACGRRGQNAHEFRSKSNETNNSVPLPKRRFYTTTTTNTTGTEPTEI